MKRTAFITAATLVLLTGTAFNALAQNITTTVINDDTVTVTTGHIKDTTTHIKPKAWYSYFFETRMGADMLAYPTFATLDLAVAPGCTFRNGKLTVRLSSSVIRTRLAMQKDGIADEMNRILVADSIFTGCGDGQAPVREIILR